MGSTAARTQEQSKPSTIMHSSVHFRGILRKKGSLMLVPNNIQYQSIPTNFRKSLLEVIQGGMMKDNVVDKWNSWSARQAQLVQE